MILKKNYSNTFKLILIVGQVCKEPGQHTCMKIGFDPIMCISDSLLCDGVTNCPQSSTTSDEDEKLCSRNFYAPTSLEQLALEIYKKWKPQHELFNNNKWLQDDPSSTDPKKTFFRDWQELKTLKQLEGEFFWF